MISDLKEFLKKFTKLCCPNAYNSNAEQSSKAKKEKKSKEPKSEYALLKDCFK